MTSPSPPPTRWPARTRWRGRPTSSAAYHSVLALREEEIDILFDLIAMRHVTTITITEWRARLYPENRAYIMRNHPRAAEGLRAFAAIDRDAARRVFRQACGME